MTTTSFRKMFDDLPKCGVEAIGEDALTFIDSLLTPEEIRESNLRVELIGETIKEIQE